MSNSKVLCIFVAVMEIRGIQSNVKYIGPISFSVHTTPGGRTWRSGVKREEIWRKPTRTGFGIQSVQGRNSVYSNSLGMTLESFINNQSADIHRYSENVVRVILWQ